MEKFGESEELNFNDVFGGPPRRLSLQEVRERYSFGESEKPVFREERRHRAADFFDDIFKGPANFSLPAMDFPTFGSHKVGGLNNSWRVQESVMSVDSPSIGNQFHFSIYKWAGRGVPIVIGNHFKSERKQQSKSSSVGEQEKIEKQVPVKNPNVEGETKDSKKVKEEGRKGVVVESAEAEADVSPKGKSFSPENLDDLLEDNFVVHELSDVTQKESSEETKAIDAKIRQWSVGKKGNIRSLLSTLQYVLWPQSGWKAVPLVDLIESNSVKRAYQKALLRLHPDKLQQKGADFNHKYIAEKVFDILQEAWEHFNTCSSLGI